MKLGDYIFSNIHANEYLKAQYNKLCKKYTFSMFRANNKAKEVIINIADLLRFADILSKSISKEYKAYHKNIAQNIVVMLSKIYPANKTVNYVKGSVLSNNNNYVGLANVASDYENSDFIDSFFEEVDKQNHKVPIIESEELYFNNTQKEAFQKLMTAKYYSYSGPTSMGKTFLIKILIKKYIQEGKKKNFVIVVPSKALINEIKNEFIKSLSSYLMNNKYKVVTNPSVINFDRYSYVMIYTQERLTYHFKQHGTENLDYVFIDEAHKISEVGLRSAYFYKIVNTLCTSDNETNIFFSCPNIPNPEVYLKLVNSDDKISDIFEYSPVNQQKCIIDISNSDIKVFDDLSKEFIDMNTTMKWDLINLVKRIGFDKDNIPKNNIIFCNSKVLVVGKAKEYYAISKDIEDNQELLDLIEDIKREIHPECYLVDFLKRGISYHVGYLPSNIKEKIENLYKKRIIKTIFCTSTLLEGVNLPADNLIIFINGNSDYILKDSSGFKNLLGRVGRKTYNLVGNVYIIPNTEEIAMKVVPKLEELIEKPVEKQKLSIEEVLDEKAKKLIIDQLLKGDTHIEKDKYTFEKLDLLRFSMNILIKSIVCEDKTNTIFKMFSSNLNESQIKTIRDNFKDSKYIDDDTNITQNQLTPLQNEILANGLMFPKVINHENITAFLKKLHKIYKWGKYETKKEIGNTKMLRYYAVILNKWMHGESVNRIIAASIDYAEKNDIYDFKLNKKVVFQHTPKQVNEIIGNCLYTIENVILFSISNYFSKFSEIYKKIKGVEEIENDWSEYVDFGTNDDIIIKLQKHGFSREVAKEVKKNGDVSIVDARLKINIKNKNIYQENALQEIELVEMNFNEIFE